MVPPAFHARDIAELAARGIAVEDAEAQLALLRHPPAPLVLQRACTVGDGITRLDPAAHTTLLADADAAVAAGRVMKFVPASGAATRMFKDLIAAHQGDQRPSSLPAPQELFASIDLFPFGEEIRRHSGVQGLPASEEEERAMLQALLHQMRSADLPKGLVLFHRVADTGRPRTAFEEHLLEGTRYARAGDGTCCLHFTVAPEVRDLFERTLQDITPYVLEQRPDTVLDVTFSEQQPSTDTLALDADGQPFRMANGSLLFRPAGHGALLSNLQDLNGDLVVIKNIDNVVPDETADEVVRWKRLLIGFLAHVQAETFGWLEKCHAPEVPEAVLDGAMAFARERFARVPVRPLSLPLTKREFVLDALDRPIRICGVVRNDGEPGGAPFWVLGSDGLVTAQIVEESQVSANNSEQQKIFRSATHFNPVDVVCGVRNWRGQPFDLRWFVDASMVFVSTKSHEGRDLRALERPGLWNGAMAGWNTVFVEVPASTFAPVKTVFDLLRPQHRATAAATDRSRTHPAESGVRRGHPPTS